MTYRQIQMWMKGLSDQQLDSEAWVTEGCDENGNAAFSIVRDFVPAKCSEICSATAQFDPEQPILLIDEFESVMTDT